MKARIEKLFYNDQIKILVKEPLGRGMNRFFKAVVEWKDISVGEVIPEDMAIILDREDAVLMAKAIYEACIEAGILPNAEEVKGELRATKKHLEDLQLAFKKLLDSVPV